MMAAEAAPVRPGPGLPRRSTSGLTTRTTRYPLAQPADKSSQNAETLFSHSSVRIVCFSAPTPQRQSSVSSVKSAASSPGAAQASGSLPWTSRTERVISIGPLRLYRVPGSVAFLHSGALLLSLLPKSQCWCVDGQSKFALRIQAMIYRIELPYENDGEKAKVEDLKEVLREIIQYEKTACPFKRGFEVELPDEPDSPMRRVLVAPAPKGNHWEHDDMWKADALQQTPNRESTPDLSDGYKSPGSTVDEDSIIHHKPSREFIFEAKPEATDGLAKDPFGGRPIQAPAGFVADEASRISRLASTHKPQLDMGMAKDAAVTSRETVSAPALEAAPVVDFISSTSTEEIQPLRKDASPLDTVAVLTQPLEEPPKEASPHLNPTETSFSVDQPTQPTVAELEEQALKHVEVAAEVIAAEPAFTSSQVSPPSTQDYVSIPTTSAASEDVPPKLSTAATDIAHPEPVLSPDTTHPAPESTVLSREIESANEAGSEPTSSPPGPPISSSTTPPATSTFEEVKPHLQPPPPETPRKSSRTTSGNETSPRRRASTRALRHMRSRTFGASGEEDLSSSLISRALSILLGPPSGLVAIMVQIANRILASGPFGTGAQAWRLGLRKARKAQMPGRWVDSSEEEDDNEEYEEDRASVVSGLDKMEDGGYDSFEEDDYGIPLSNDARSTAIRSSLASTSLRNRPAKTEPAKEEARD